MDSLTPVFQTPRLSKTVKRRNRRRIRKMHMAIEELASAHSAERTPVDDVDQDLQDIDTTYYEHRSTDGNISAFDADEEARNKFLWNMTSSDPALACFSRTPSSALACSSPAPASSAAQSRRSSIAPPRPIPCTAQLFAVDIAASVAACEMRFVQPDATQDHVTHLREVMALGSRFHAQASLE